MWKIIVTSLSSSFIYILALKNRNSLFWLIKRAYMDYRDNISITKIYGGFGAG